MPEVTTSGSIPGTPVINFQLNAIGNFSHNGDPDAYGGRSRGKGKRRRFNPDRDSGFQILDEEDFDQDLDEEE